MTPARRLSDLVIAPGGFCPSPPVRRGKPKLTANIEPKSAGSYTQSLPSLPPAHFSLPFFFPLLHFSPPETPPLPPTVPPANSSALVSPSRAPESDAKASLVSAAPPQALWERVGGGDRAEPRGEIERKANPIGQAAAMGTGGCGCIVMVTAVCSQDDPPVEKRVAGKPPRIPRLDSLPF